MPTLEIDGQTVTVEDGLNLIQAAERLGIEIPHYCYHPGLTDRRQLPHVPGRDREDAQAADRLQHPRQRGHGGADAERPRQDRRARAVLEFLLHQPPDRLSDLRPGRRVQAAGLLHGLRPRSRAGSPLEDKVHKGKALDDRPARHARPGALHPVHALRALPGRGHARPASWAIFERGDHCEIDLFPGQAARQRLLGQRRRHLPGRRAHHQGLPLPRPRLVPRAHAVASAPAAPPAATSTSTTGAARSTASVPATTTT